MYFNYVHTATHLSTNADLFLQFCELLLVHTEFLHLKYKHKLCLIFTHIWLNIFHTTTTNIFYQRSQTQILWLPQVWQLIIHKYKRVHIYIFPTKVLQNTSNYMPNNTLTFSHASPGNLQFLFFVSFCHIELTRMHSCQKPRNSSRIFFSRQKFGLQRNWAVSTQ